MTRVMSRPRALLTLGAAAILATVSVALAHAWLSEAARQAASGAEPAGPKTVPLAVAARPLRYGDRLGPGDVRLVPWPESAVPPEGLNDLAWLGSAPGGASGAGPVVLKAMAENEPVLPGKITGLGAPSRLAATIAPGLRAARIRTQGAADMAALVGPGDRVDVLIAREVPGAGQGREQRRELRSDVLLRGLRVLGLERGLERGLEERPGRAGVAAGRARSVTLEVTLAQAQLLAVAEKVGALSLALRGFESFESKDAAESRPVSSRDLPAGPDLEAVQPAALPAAGAPAPLQASALPPDTRVRVVRGLEVSDYEVAREGSGSALRAIDAVKGGPLR